MATDTEFDPSRAVLADRVDEFVAERAQPSDTGVARRVIGDTAVSIAKGVIGAGEAAVGLADLASGGRAGKALEDSTGWDPKRTKAALDAWSSPEQRAASAEVGAAKGFVDTAVAALQSPSVIAQAAAESAPLMLGGGAIARGARALVPGVAPVVAGAAGEGVITAGAQAEQIRQETPDRVLTPEQALLAGASGAGTGLLTLGAGRVAQKLGISDVDIALAGGGLAGQNKGIIRRMAEGALSEGVLEEMPQSAQEQAVANVALGRPWDEGVGSAAAMGALTGGVIGAGVNVAHGPRATEGSPADSSDLAARDEEIDQWRRHAAAGPISAAVANEKLRELGARPFDGGEGDGALQNAVRAGLPVVEPGLPRATPAGTGDAGGSHRGNEIESIVGGQSAEMEARGAPAAPPLARGNDSRRVADDSERMAGGSQSGVSHSGNIQPHDHAVAQLGDQLRALNERISAAANQAATSLENDTPQPTAAQAAAGVYKKGHVRLHGLQISIENPAGSIRVAKDGSWASRMPSHYGYIRRSKGADGDQIDAFLGDQPHSQHVFVIDQMSPTTGKFDEVKVMLGFPSIEAARETYRAAHPRDWNGLGAITPTTVKEFKGWLKSGDTKSAFALSQVGQLPGGGAAQRGQAGGVIAPAVQERVRHVDSGARALQQSERQVVQALRRERNLDVPALGQLRGVPRGHGTETASPVAVGSDRQQWSVHPAELPLGVAPGFDRESPMLAAGRAQRQDDDGVRSGERSERSQGDGPASTVLAEAAIGDGAEYGAPATVDGALDRIRGGQAHARTVGDSLGRRPEGAGNAAEAHAAGTGTYARSDDEPAHDRGGARDHVSRSLGASAWGERGRVAAPPQDHAVEVRDDTGLDVAGTPPRRMQDISGRAGRASDGAKQVDSASRALEDAARRAGAESSRHRHNVDSLADHARAANPDQDPRVRAITSAASAQVTGILDGQRIDAGVGRSLASGERTLVAAAVQNLLSDVGFPAVFLEDLTPVHVQDGEHAGDGTYRYEARAVGIHQRVLREVASGDPYAARALRGILAHEVMHHIDNGRACTTRPRPQTSPSR